MKHLSMLLVACVASAADAPKPNTLSREEIAAGKLLLFDGETTFGWTSKGMVLAKDGLLTLVGEGKDWTEAEPTLPLGNRWELTFEYRLEGTAGGVLGLKTAQQVAHHDLPKTDKPEWIRYRLALDIDPEASTFKAEHEAVDPAGKVLSKKAASRGLEGPDKQTVRPVWYGQPGARLQLRSVVIRPLGLKPIFNGKDLAGWKVFPDRKSQFFVEEGILRVKDGPGDLQTEAQWSDFVLQLECKTHGKHLNSGVFFRCVPGLFTQGYEAQIRNQWEGDDRTKPVDFGTGAIYRRIAARRVVSDDLEWFTMTVLAHDNRFGVWVNGILVTDWTDTRPANDNARQGSKTGKGHISLQGHDPTTDLSFRNFRIAELAK